MSYYFTACKMCGVILETFPGTDSSEIYSLNLYLFQFLGNGKPGNGGTRKTHCWAEDGMFEKCYLCDTLAWDKCMTWEAIPCAVMSYTT